ncbi:MAG TPA: hypothetical protein VN745_07765, partial [Verrucomicrobiae bacterium]|nr:hypothetical protein [Verrucomicrobiae bacterium]
FEDHGYRFTIMEVEGRRISRVKIKRVEASGATQPQPATAAATATKTPVHSHPAPPPAQKSSRRSHEE